MGSSYQFCLHPSRTLPILEITFLDIIRGTDGINVLAVCDHAYWFLWVGVNALGGMSDQTNYNMSSISTLVKDLPAGVYVAGDNTFQPTEHMIPPFLGSQKLNVWNDLFNFHLSQIRMKIEQTFGIFVMLWGIFNRSLRMGLANVSVLILTAAKLHNFILQWKYPKADVLPSHHEIICDFGVSNV